MRITKISSLATPVQIQQGARTSAATNETVALGRKEVEDVLTGKDNRFLVIVGPCSVHDRTSTLQYARRLVNLRFKFKDKLCIIMRAYFEKPRTTIGWKGFVNDPFLDGSYKVHEGAMLTRKILCRITDLGLPVATEFVDPYTPQIMDDLISLAAIGARTAESQTHREMASGLSMPVGFKNGTGGSIQLAVDGIVTARASHYFKGVDAETGTMCLFRTHGNPYGYLVLRGGKSGSNYEEQSIADAVEMLRRANVDESIVVDCSHANAMGDYKNQLQVARIVMNQRNEGNRAIKGIMLESHLFEGRQNLGESEQKYGVSKTDSCIGWSETEEMLAHIYEQLKL